jgi:hypothetical protein
VDSDVQAALLKQLIVNWTVIFGVIAAALLAAESYEAGFTLGFSGALAAIWRDNVVLLFALCALSPFIVYESLKLSHRFAGPMQRFSRELKRLGDGEDVAPMQFREDDFWKDLADGFNAVQQRIEQLKQHKSDDETEVPLVHSAN